MKSAEKSEKSTARNEWTPEKQEAYETFAIIRANYESLIVQERRVEMPLVCSLYNSSPIL